MKLNEWRQDKVKVKAAKALIDSPTFREMLECLSHENPVYYPLQSSTMPQGVSISPERHLGRIEGACFVLEHLKSMGELLPDRSDIPVTYGAGPIKR